MNYMTDMHFRYLLNHANKTASLVGTILVQNAQANSKTFIRFSVPRYIGEYKVTSIGSRAFAGMNNIELIKIPQSVNKIGACAFYKCSSLKIVHIYDSKDFCPFIFLESDAFSECEKLENVVLDSKNAEVYASHSAFANCVNLKRIDGQLTHIGIKAFFNCEQLPEITLAVKAMWHASSFNGCKSLNNIIANGNIDIDKPQVLNWLKKKNIKCKSDSNLVELSYFGTKIELLQ